MFYNCLHLSSAFLGTCKDFGMLLGVDCDAIPQEDLERHCREDLKVRSACKKTCQRCGKWFDEVNIRVTKFI